MFSASKPRQPKRPPAPCVVYGPAFWNGDEMLVLPYGTARGCAAYYLARNHATTWTGFLTALPADDREFLNAWSHEASEFAGFAEYWAQRADEEEDLTRDQAWTDYLDLSWPDERPPLGDEPFDAIEWEQVEFDCDLGPSNPQTLMTGSVPSPILKDFGQVSASVWDGDMASLKMQHEQAIVDAYRKLGHRIIRNDQLIDAACGQTGDPDALQRLLLSNDLYDDEPTPSPDSSEATPGPQSQGRSSSSPYH